MTTINKIKNILQENNTKFFVDIGASNSSEESQTESLLKDGWSGVMCECNSEKYIPLQERMKDYNVKIINEKITPDNIIDLLKKNEVPMEFYLSLDIDGYDYYVLEKILENYTPYLIVSEINEKIPPPIKFSVLYDQNYWWDGSHFYGYSLSMLENLLNKFSYKIKDLDYNNVILIKGKQTESIEKVYNDGYYNKPDRKNKFWYNNNFEEIFMLDDEEKINFIYKNFLKYINKFTVQI